MATSPLTIQSTPPRNPLQIKEQPDKDQGFPIVQQAWIFLVGLTFHTCIMLEVSTDDTTESSTSVHTSKRSCGYRPVRYGDEAEAGPTTDRPLLHALSTTAPPPVTTCRRIAAE
ncbi:uncharacterized protein CLUP02_12103 [Colletotrichum lupini]|uniref:Uncharacterized protein n=1 Tax=Colletotrichum lupini TaxID=145971 RepID=A0A9Q8WKG8_9PEZI|nr:uncharacterized protein CLUP02_12103 [Colletotrichum lupini]UQC86601.1 hypothetical protein CLUP02_12103 [Colletotrichum lupini]